MNFGGELNCKVVVECIEFVAQCQKVVSIDHET